MLFDLSKVDNLSSNIIGGKAYNLFKLMQLGFSVPDAFVITVDTENVLELKENILNHYIVKSSANFAIRSSGVGEDSLSYSFAGAFNSYMNVPREKIIDHVVDVLDSVNNVRANIYSDKRGSSVVAMAVIVQHMIVADYAGVAFSSDPIKNIDNAMLIEIVKGSGESLVSSKKTPYSIRINKLTGMVRTQQIGHDNISEVQAYGLCEILLPVIERIESAYGIPVDVEWAISKNKLYILQARPITSI